MRYQPFRTHFEHADTRDTEQSEKGQGALNDGFDGTKVVVEGEVDVVDERVVCEDFGEEGTQLGEVEEEACDGQVQQDQDDALEDGILLEVLLQRLLETFQRLPKCSDPRTHHHTIHCKDPPPQQLPIVLPVSDP